MDGGNSGYQAGAHRYWAELPRLAMPRNPDRRAAIADEGNLAAAAPYDLLRTRLLGEMTAREWTMLGVTQAGNSAAAPLTALNLALSEARRPGRNVVLVELDVAQQPILGHMGGDITSGAATATGGGAQFRAWRLADRLALLAIPTPPSEAAIRLLDPDFRTRLDDSLSRFAPDVVILHLPALLTGDAGLAAVSLAQGVLLVVDGRSDTADSLRGCQARLGESCPVLGLFLYDAEG